MPELGPYGSMRGEARKSLPYRDPASFRKANEIRAFRVAHFRCKSVRLVNHDFFNCFRSLALHSSNPKTNLLILRRHKCPKRKKVIEFRLLLPDLVWA